MRLIYFSPVPWASFSQRPHKFVEWFHSRTGKEVLWVDPYPTRFPLLSDFRRLGARKDEDHLDEDHLNQPCWIRVIQPSALPIEPLPGSGYLNALLWRRVLLEVELFITQQTTLMVVGKPSALALIAMARLRDCSAVYDAMDNFPAFYSGMSHTAMAWRERRLSEKADRILVSSTSLRDRLERYAPKIILVPNACASATLPAIEPRKVGQSHPVLGYVGTIGHWFDWRLVVNIARTVPSASVRLIGPIYSEPPIGLPNNIELLPACDHNSAIRAMQEFSVGLIPFRRIELTASVDPIKYYEYRAIGLPVISTSFGDMTLRGTTPGVFLAQAGMDLKRLVGEAIGFRFEINEIRAFREANSWQARFDASGILD
jgi:hypothetical protein